MAVRTVRRRAARKRKATSVPGVRFHSLAWSIVQYQAKQQALLHMWHGRGHGVTLFYCIYRSQSSKHHRTSEVTSYA
jgi:hypothetical protein